MTFTSAMEDYLKAAFAVAARGETVTVSALAAQLGVSLPSVSSMVKRMTADGLVERGGSREIRLSASGERHALRVVRRHRLLEAFLAEVLGLGWDEVHDEAERLEHALSERLEDRIDAHLGHPTHDPHGDPIPPKSGTHEERWAQPLPATAEGARFRVERVSDRDGSALRYLAQLGIRPSVTLEVQERAPFGGPLWVRVGGQRQALGLELAGLVHGSETQA